VASTENPQLIELEIGNIAGGGGCVARAPDGRVVFVRHTLPGERVLAQVTATTSSYLRADAIEIIRSSTDRVQPPCPHAGPGRCGGCDFQHIGLEAQRRLKSYRVTEQLQQLAGIERHVVIEPVAGDENGLGWRTRVRLGVDQSGRVGFRRHRSHELEYIEHCPIASQAVTETGAFAAEWVGVDELEVIVAAEGTESLISVDRPHKSTAPLPHVSGGLVVNGRVQQKPGALRTVVCTVEFRVSAGVFWQVHAGAARTLAESVRTTLNASPGDHVVDLYAGAGLFSVLLADDVGPQGSVLAVERDRRACADAEHNGRLFPHMKVKKASITPKLVERGIGEPDLMVLDPSREGAGKAVMSVLSRVSKVRRLVYVSCDPASFSRDIRPLIDAEWTLTSLRAFDIFPMTEHVELLGSFERPHR